MNWFLSYLTSNDPKRTVTKPGLHFRKTIYPLVRRLSGPLTDVEGVMVKAVKCKNWEKDKTCKYGAHCTFAHSDEELRSKTDNLNQFNSSFPMMMPMMFPPGMDMSQMQPFMMNNPMNVGMGVPGVENSENNISTNIEKKE